MRNLHAAPKIPDFGRVVAEIEKARTGGDVDETILVQCDTFFDLITGKRRDFLSDTSESTRVLFREVARAAEVAFATDNHLFNVVQRIRRQIRAILLVDEGSRLRARKFVIEFSARYPVDAYQ